ncbi:DUF3592 domain-containing protein [Dyella terrae]|uniref:DUF3592 domain-containing protein n=1 Tax=Dyella terrae TaxID=522259 RepID=UPI001EFC5732|nr:DUF3592 domain-containing protein [Dyella terrae]ULU23881.1 hypothetical protein DYST_00779 [Dyella terrae]
MTTPSRNDWRPLRNWEKVAVSVVATVVLAWALVQTYQTAVFLARCSRTTGVIIENSGHPLILFTTEAGASVQFVQNGGAVGKPGAPMPVAYDPSDPMGSARADTFFALWGSILGVLPIGLGCLAVVFLGGEIKTTGRFG